MKKLISLIALAPLTMGACATKSLTDVDLDNGTYFYLGYGKQGQEITDTDTEGEFNVILANAKIDSRKKVSSAIIYESMGYLKQKLPASAVAKGEEDSRYVYDLVEANEGKEFWIDAWNNQLTNVIEYAGYEAQLKIAEIGQDPLEKEWIDENCSVNFVHNGNPTNIEQYDKSDFITDREICRKTEAAEKIVLKEATNFTILAANFDKLTDNIIMENSPVSTAEDDAKKKFIELLMDSIDAPEYKDGIKEDWSYGSDKFHISKVYEKTAILFIGKNEDEVKALKFDIRNKDGTNIDNIAGATATESNLYAAALQAAILAEFELLK